MDNRITRTRSDGMRIVSLADAVAKQKADGRWDAIRDLRTQETAVMSKPEGFAGLPEHHQPTAGRVAGALERMSDERRAILEARWGLEIDPTEFGEVQTISELLQALQAERAEVERLRAEWSLAHQDAAFYRSCALSGEIPKDGSQPSAITKATGEQTDD